MSADRDAVLGIGGPLAAAPSDILVREAFGAELEQQRALSDDIGLADLAYVVMLVETGIVPVRGGADLIAGLLALQERPADFALDAALGDVYTNREAWLSAHTDAAGWLGTGRARREATTTGFTLTVRARILTLVRSLLAAGAALIDVAERHRQSVMPDYTYLQAGQPTSFGHYLLTFAYPVLRDLERARALFAHADRCPAGCGSTNGSTLPLDRGRLAELLGFPALVDHARDAMWQADASIEALALACAAIVNLDRLAEDLAIFATAEFGFVTLGDEHSRASKVMPQKKNPFALSYVRAVANRTIGTQAGVTAAGRTPSGQMDNRFAAYGDVPAALSQVAGAAVLMAAAVRGLHFDAEAARATLARSSAFASDLAELVMRAGAADYRAAHALVGRVVRSRTSAGGAMHASFLADALDAEAQVQFGRPLQLAVADIEAVLDPLRALERRAGVGGAAPARVADMIGKLRERFAEHSAWATAAEERIERARDALFTAARRLGEPSDATLSGRT